MRQVRRGGLGAESELGFDGLATSKPKRLDSREIVSFAPAVDADLYVPSLLEGMLGSKTWMASRLGQVGGQSSVVSRVIIDNRSRSRLRY